MHVHISPLLAALPLPPPPTALTDPPVTPHPCPVTSPCRYEPPEDGGEAVENGEAEALVAENGEAEGKEGESGEGAEEAGALVAKEEGAEEQL